MAEALNTAKEYIPDISGSMQNIGAAIANNMSFITIGVIVFIILFFLYKLMKHRIEVVILTPVEGGYVQNSGRYRLQYNKENKRPSFVPIFGNETLPAYDSKYFQKIKGGIPFITPMRTITLVMLNKYSPVVVNSNGQLEHIDNKRWLFDTHRAEYIKKLNKGNLAYFLAIYVPLVVALGAIVFWIVTIFMQVGVVEHFGNTLTDLVKRLGG